MTPFPNIPAKAYVRSCEICIKLIPTEDVGFGCLTCFLEGRLTLFCSAACRREHDSKHHPKLAGGGS